MIAEKSGLFLGETINEKIFEKPFRSSRFTTILKPFPGFQFAVFFVLSAFTVAATEQQEIQQIIDRILNAKQAIINTTDSKSPDAFIFLSFWDFDGTILKGDCSEGYTADGKRIYSGFAQLGIENGLSLIYPAAGGFETFWKDYRHMDEQIGAWLAYPFIPQIFSQAPIEKLDQLCRTHYRDVLSDYYFASSIEILNSLKQHDIQPHIISASGDVFVRAAAQSLDLPPDRFNGIKLKIKDGRLTNKIEYPVTWAQGKTKKLISIASEIQQQNTDKQVIILAAFGNSYSTDGPFLKYVAGRKLPAANPVVVMINGGKPRPGYKGLFSPVTFSETVTEKSNKN